MTKQHHYRAYDHRTKKMIVNSANPNLFPALNIPRSTALSWIRKGVSEVVTIPQFDSTTDELIKTNQSLSLELEQVKARERLSYPEITKIKELVVSSKYAHFSIYGLATHMKRTRQLLASPSSWSRIIRDFDLKRSRNKIYPPQKKLGIRTTAVNELVKKNVIPKLTIAQIDVDYSNSMIEALFYRLKNAHLYMQKLSSLDKLKTETDFYFEQSNEVIPHSSLGDATPIEIFTGLWSKTSIDKLANDCLKARSARMAWNLNQSCGSCPI